jgi:hypothetical protein
MKYLYGLLAALAVIGTALPTAAESTNSYKFTLYNETSVTFRYVYATPRHGDENWSPDLLGQYVLEPHYHSTMTVTNATPYCEWDIVGVTKSGVRYGGWRDLCEHSDVYLYDSNYISG